MIDSGEVYCAIINIVDFLALNDVGENIYDTAYHVLDELLDIYTLSQLKGESFTKSRQEWFEGIADANDAGAADNWYEMVAIFKQLWANGDRI